MSQLVLRISILPGRGPLKFMIPVDLTGPSSLRITKSPDISDACEISVLDEDGKKRVWAAYDIFDVHFEDH
jgi:hypothetical protein